MATFEVEANGQAFEAEAPSLDAGKADIIVHHIEFEPTHLGSQGQRYRVHYAGGVLIESTRDPEYDACRALLALGITGTLRTRGMGAAHWAMQLEIERDAKLTVSETDRDGLQIVRWRPFSTGDAPGAVLFTAVSARTAENEPAATIA